MRRFLIAILVTALVALAVVISLGPRNPTGLRVTDAAAASPTVVTNATRPAAPHPSARATAVQKPAAAKKPAAVKKAAAVKPTVAKSAAPVHVAAPARVVHPAAAPVVHQVFTPAPTRTVAPTPGANSCATAVAYLSAHAAPGFRFQCPGYALGHQAMTCINEPGICAGEKIIVLNVVCPASYMNEASNSWVLMGLAHAPIDPYGYCH